MRDVFHPDVWLQFICDLDADLPAARKAIAWSRAGHSRRPAPAAECSRGFVGRYPYRPAQPETRSAARPLPGWLRLVGSGRSISLLRGAGGRKDLRRTDCPGRCLGEFSARSKLGRLRGYGGQSRGYHQRGDEHFRTDRRSLEPDCVCTLDPDQCFLGGTALPDCGPIHPRRGVLVFCSSRTAPGATR